MSIYYTGVGSRQTPPEIQLLMTRIAERLAAMDYILRSGHAKGADQAFARGAGEFAEIYLPFPTFNAGDEIHPKATYRVRPSKDALDLARQYHPAWTKLQPIGQQLQARNSHQVLGDDLQHPSAFVICWTPQGSFKGGTGQAIRIAEANRIPVFDLGTAAARNRLEKWLSKP